MKWFYIISVIAVGALFAAPFYMLPYQDKSMLKNPVPDFNGGTRKPIVAYDSYSSKIRSLDPATCGDTSSASLQSNFFEGLYTYHYLKRPAEVIPLLAADMPSISADGLTWTIPIKKGIYYRRNAAFGTEPLLDDKGKAVLDDKGNPKVRNKTREMTADDFVLAFKRVGDTHISTPLAFTFIDGRIEGLAEYRAKTAGYQPGDFSRYNKENISGVKALDRYTLQVKLTDKYPQFQYVLAIGVYAPVPHEVIDYWLSTREENGKRVPLELKLRNPEIKDFLATVGTGPYYLEDFVDGGRIVLVRNLDFRPDFYPTEGEPSDKAAGLLKDAGKRVPFIDVTYLTYVQESNPMWMLFMFKQHDMAGIPQEQYDKVIGVGRTLAPDMAKEGIKLMIYTSPAIYYLAYNMSDKVVGKSKSLRQAMSLALDVQQEIDLLRNGRGKWCRSVLPSDLPERKEIGDSPYAKLDRDKARELLKKARQELSLAPNQPFPTITIDYPDVSQAARRQAEFYKSQFAEIGLDVKVELEDWPTFQDRMHRGLTQIAAGSGWHADYPDAENFLQLFYGPNVQGGTNSSKYQNTEYDKLYDQIKTMKAGPERTVIIKKMVNMLNEDCPVIFESEPESFLLLHPWVLNTKPHPVGYGFAKYQRIDAEARREAGGR